MALSLLIAVLSLPLLVYLMQEYRDARGRRRNEAGRCYRCGALMNPPVAVRHYHYRSPSTLHFYCLACADAEDRKGRIWISVGGAAVAATFASVALRESVSSFWDAAIYGVASVAIGILVVVLLLGPRKSRGET